MREVRALVDTIFSCFSFFLLVFFLVSSLLCGNSVEAAATCANIQCLPGQTCLTDLRNGSPRCQTCSYPPSSCSHLQGNEGYLPPILCGSNHVTYPSWCQMKADECQHRIVIETKYSGPCHKSDRWKNSVHSNSVDDLTNNFNL
uniref:Follistatin n=1 Tax=Cacopsylla melanoneura TaxID=428564 RepID=A0A8D8M466_9HEMI